MRIPNAYLDEFKAKEVSLIKSRISLLAILAASLYSLIDILSLIFYPKDFNPAEIPVLIFLLIGASIIFFFAKRVYTVRQAKTNAYIFTIFLLIILTKVSLIYIDYVKVSAPIYLFLLFLVCFTIPWHPFEVIPITIMHILAYSFLFMYVCLHLPGHMSYRPDWYLDGVLSLFMGLILCLVIRYKENSRDIENFVLLKEVEEKNTQMRKELDLATRIHKTLIPRSISTNLVNIAVMYLPISYMGGDYAKFHFLDKDKLIFIICDVTGHGVSAALLVNRFHAEFEHLARQGREPGTLLKELNDFILRDFTGTNMYLSAFCGLLDFQKKEFIYSNHGHPTQYIYRITKSEIQKLISQGSLLGLPVADENIHQNKISFDNGDKILLFTDGIIESKNKDGAEYGEEKMEDFIRKNFNLDVEVFNKMLLTDLNAFTGEDFKDDIFMLSIHVK